MSEPARQRAAIARRQILAAPFCAALLSRAAIAAEGAAQQHLAELERRHGGRLGVAVLDIGSGRRLAYRGDERFPMCSTHKALSAGLVLARVDRGEESLGRHIAYGPEVLVPYSPATKPHAGRDGMSIGQLCEAALTLSDNTAANLLLDSYGGPARLTAYLRGLGDPVTRLDRREPELNTALPGDPRDTTTPLAMLDDIRRLVLGMALTPGSRAQLAAWLVDCKTGDKRLRAGVPGGSAGSWQVGDKTGTGDNNTANDVAVICPPDRPPIVVTAFYTYSTATAEQRDAVLAAVGQLAARS